MMGLGGCIRLDPKNIDWLFHQVKKHERVRVVNRPIKFSLEADRSMFLEVHEPLTDSKGHKRDLTLPKEIVWWMSEFGFSMAKARAPIQVENGMPIEIATPD